MRMKTPEEGPAPDISRRAGAVRLVVLLMLVVGLGHFNRISISVAGTERIIPREGISAPGMGMIYSGFLLCYTLAMLPGGLLIDRFGARAALAVLCVGSVMFVALTGVTSWMGANAMLLWAALLIVRCLMGVVNAPLHPGSARLVGESVSRAQVSFANGLVTFAACVGIAGTYFLFGEMMDWLGWPGAFYASSGLTLLVLFAWLWGTMQPAGSHSHFAPTTSVKGILNELPILFRHRSLICLTLSYAAMGYVQYLFFYWIEYYFKDVIHLGTERSRLYSTLVVLANGLGMVVGGWLADRAPGWSSRIGIGVVPAAGLIGSAVTLVAGLLSPHAELTLGCFILAMGTLGMCEGPSWTVAVALGGRRGGTTAALMNTGGNAGGLLAPLVTPQLSQFFGWQIGMGLASIVALVGAGLWLGVTSRSTSEEQ